MHSGYNEQTFTRINISPDDMYIEDDDIKNVDEMDVDTLVVNNLSTNDELVEINVDKTTVNQVGIRYHRSPTQSYDMLWTNTTLSWQVDMDGYMGYMNITNPAYYNSNSIAYMDTIDGGLRSDPSYSFNIGTNEVTMEKYIVGNGSDVSETICKIDKLTSNINHRFLTSFMGDATLRPLYYSNSNSDGLVTGLYNSISESKTFNVTGLADSFAENFIGFLSPITSNTGRRGVFEKFTHVTPGGADSFYEKSVAHDNYTKSFQKLSIYETSGTPTTFIFGRSNRLISIPEIDISYDFLYTVKEVVMKILIWKW